MSSKEIQKIIDNVAFSMEVEGFQIPEEQKTEWMEALDGKSNFREILDRYIAEAKLIDELAKGEKSGREKGWLTIEEVEAALDIG